MRRPSPLVITGSVLACIACAAPGAAPQRSGPDLVVMVVVDQLRGDLIHRYAPAFEGGFARLLREGRVYSNASHLHASTSTAIGHATLSTGVAPSRHGIVGNDFWDLEAAGEPSLRYSMDDPLSPILGFPGQAGRSPANMRRGGLADWMVADDAETVVLSVSRKDRGAIPLAGKVRGHVYWLEAGGTAFVTSEYYRDRYPSWVARFNADRMPAILGDSIWGRLTPDAMVRLARRDSVPYEGDGVHVTFPHLREEEAGGDTPAHRYGWAGETPAPDRAVLELAKVGIRELGLGSRPEGPDFLAISFSQTDYIGHSYGPLSQEQLSNLIHLDGLLAELWAFLDQEIGEGRWIMGLSADHGVMTAPEWLVEESGGPERRITREEVAAMRRVADEAAALGGDPDQVADRVARAVEALPWIERAFTPRDLETPQPDSIRELFVRSHSSGRSWGPLGRYGVYVQQKPEILYRTSSRGSSHGSPYWHDRHVPFILYGGGIEAGVFAEPARTFDLAPTLGRLSGVTLPEDLDGRPLVGGPGGSP